MENKTVKISTGLKRVFKKTESKKLTKFSDEFINNPNNRNTYLQNFSNALVVEIASNDY